MAGFAYYFIQRNDTINDSIFHMSNGMFYRLNNHLVLSLETEDLVACVDAALSKVVSVLEESTSLDPEHQPGKGRVV